MYEADDTDADPQQSDVAGVTADDRIDAPALPGDASPEGPGETAAEGEGADDAPWCPEGDDLGLDVFSPMQAQGEAGDSSAARYDLDSEDVPTGARSHAEPASDDTRREPTDEAAPVAGDDLGPLAFDATEPEAIGPLRLDAPNNLGPLGFDFVERGPIEQAEYEDRPVPYSPIADRELAENAEEIAALYGGMYDFEHATAEHDAQESSTPEVDSPIWVSPQERANMESELRADAAEEMDRSIAQFQHEEAEAQAQANLVDPGVAAYMQELDQLGLETDMAHAAAEHDAQQSLPLEPPAVQETSHDWGIRIAVGATTPGVEVKRPSKPHGMSVGGEWIKLEVKNLTTGEVGVFDGAGLGGGWSTPSVDLGASSDWIVFQTSDEHKLEDFSGRASLSNASTPLGSAHSTIRFSDPDGWIPLWDDIDVEHESLADSVWLGDSVDISDATHHLGISITASTVILQLAARYFEDPEPDLGDVVRDAIRETGAEP